MLRSKLWVATMLATLGTTPLAVAGAAQDRDGRAQRQQEEHRMYDNAHRDYHNWNGDEDRRYREFVAERHRRYREFSRLNRRQQNEYWQWRHDHEGNDRR